MANLTEIQKCLIENISNKNVIFVFSTDVVKNSWIDWIVMNPEISGTNTVPLERFIAWDNFKGEFIKSSQEGKSSVPSLMRKFFVRDLICKNSENHFLKKIINPKYADSASSFADWICKILPSLHLWYEKFTSFIENESEEAEIQKNDEENQDYLELYKQYSAFLEKNNMFEPSWIQPDFSGDNDKIFIIFYPEILEDYADYIEIFSKNKNIKLINLPPERKDGSDSPKCYKYSDARQELRRTILQLRKLVHPEEFNSNEESNVRWDEIALSVPKLEIYKPYLERELKKYCIPFVIRAGLPLTTNCAGQIFSDIYECYQSNFSYDCVRALLQNEYIPWKKKKDDKIATDLSILRENLIREGNRMRCICGYNEKNGKNVDIWEEALSNNGKDNQEYNFYKRLKQNIVSLCQSKTFADIETAWTIFKNDYLDEEAYSKEANDILGHCITKLKEMIQIENEYEEKNSFVLGNHYEFFLNELESKSYTPQNKTVGLNVYPYKLTAPAYFKYQFIINASQSNLEVPFKRLSFLSSEKRNVLGLLEEDKRFNASHSFIRLYKQNSYNNSETVSFSFCEDSFDGFAIAHTFLNLQSVRNPLSELDEYDFYLNEKKTVLNSGKSDFYPEKQEQILLTKNQIDNFLNWKKSNLSSAEEYYASKPVYDKVIEKLVTNRQEKSTNFAISQTDANNFFPCPRKWLLSQVLRLKEDSLDTDLMKPFDMGNVNHKILENFMLYYKNQALPVTNNDELFDNEEEIVSIVKNIAKSVVNGKSDFSDSPLVLTMLNSQLDNITETIMTFLHRFCIKKTVKENINKLTKTEGFGGYIVKAVESESHLEGKEYDIFGKIDLVLTSPDTCEDTGWTIIDYKNSSVKKASEILVQDDQTLGNFQMPMYISLQTQNHPETRDFTTVLEKIDYAGFEGITSTSRSSAIDSNKIGRQSQDFINTMDEFSTYLENFKTAVKTKDFEPKTFRQKQSEEKSIRNHFDIDVIEDCKKCQFNSICRYNYTVGKRKIKTITTTAEKSE